ncbi:uncharacterized protein LOC120347683 [Styela clava]
MGRTSFYIEDILKRPERNNLQTTPDQAFLSCQANYDLFWLEYKRNSIASDQSLLWWKLYWNNFRRYYLKISEETGGVFRNSDFFNKFEQTKHDTKSSARNTKELENCEQINKNLKEEKPPEVGGSKYPSDSPLFKLEMLTSVKFMPKSSDICPIKRLLEKKVPTHSRRRKSRTAFTAQQLSELEKVFRKQKYLTPSDRDRIANNLNLSSAQVITWFQNRRAKYKRDVEEMRNDLLYARKLKKSNIVENQDSKAKQATTED